MKNEIKEYTNKVFEDINVNDTIRMYKKGKMIMYKFVHEIQPFSTFFSLLIVKNIILYPL